MITTSRGVQFMSQDKPDAVAFVDVGRVIKVYDQGDNSLLAALQLAQAKWGGVQLNGTDEYKRRCLELAVRNGIRVANPELQSAIQEKQAKLSRENSMSIFALAHELGKKACGKPVPIVTSAGEGKEYSGLLLGVIEKEGRFYAAQCLLGEHIFLHQVSKDDLHTLHTLTGQDVYMTSGGGRIQSIVESQSRDERERLEKVRGWSR
jgi:hypothetical protein